MRRGVVLVIWLAALAFAAWVVFARTTISADLTGFLPRSATPTQQLLVEQLRDGVASRLVLFGIEGDDEAALAQTSRAFVRALQASGHFLYVNNGEQALTQRERAFAFEHRYLLSRTVTPERFTVEGLKQSLDNALGLLASPAGVLLQRGLARDPTAEIVNIVQSLASGTGPALRHGVWFTADGRRALLMAETRASGFDSDAQQRVQRSVDAAFAQARGERAMTLLATGPSVFALQSRNAIQGDAWRLSMIATGVVALILLVAYRSLPLLALGLLPVASGVLAGIAAVSLGFGTVHGITLGFGATLIGEAIDYPTYVFTQTARGETIRDAVVRVWPTLRLAVLTTVFGALAMLLSSFQGLAQLGLFSLAGVLVAGLVTRFVLPELVSAPLRSMRIAAPPWLVDTLMHRAGVLRPVLWIVLALSVGVLAARHATLWEEDLANLNPVPLSAQRLDQALRESMGAPDVRLMLAVRGNSREATLQKAEETAAWLDGLRRDQLIQGYDSPSFYLPSQAAQRARQQALPDAQTLRERLQRAAKDLPFRDDLFEPFIADVTAARSAPLLDAHSLQGTAWDLKVRALLLERGRGWVALLPLSGVRNVAAIEARVGTLDAESVHLLDLKAESNRMVSAYRDQSLRLALLGALAIAATLAVGLRRASRIVAVMFPVLCAVAATAALLVAMDVRLSLFHLVSLLLVLGVGVNYALFFNRDLPLEEEQARNLFSLVVCNLTTVCAFGALGFSGMPILRAIGGTVAAGAFLSLVFAAAWGRGRRAR